MLNVPKKTKYKKIKKGKLVKFKFKSDYLIFGNIGLKAAEAGIINGKQIEASRQAINWRIKRQGKIWINVFTDLPITSKSSNARMGKGKGSLSYWGVRVRSGTVLFEIIGVDNDTAWEALRTGGAKLPIKTKIFN